MGRNTVRVQVADALIDSLFVGSMVGASMVAPNAVQMIGKVYLRHLNKRERNRELQSVMRYMQRQGLVVVTEQGGEFSVSITERGKRRHARFQFENLHIPAMERWDQKWRIVMFDVPEKHASARRALAIKLQDTGFKLLQKSAWVHPFDCREQVELIKYVYPELARYIVFLETDTIDSHNQLLKQFHSII